MATPTTGIIHQAAKSMLASCLDVVVSRFEDYYKVTNPKEVNLMVWLQSPKHAAKVDRIRSIEDKGKRDTEKAGLPAITPSGIFTHRAEQHLVKHSGLIQFDIDIGDNTHLRNYGELKTLICQSPNVAYCGLSVSGTGLWGLVPVACPDKHSQHFDFLKHYFSTRGVMLDTKPRNVASLRGYSFDGAAYFNHAAVPLKRYLEEKHTEKRIAAIGSRELTGSHDDDCFNWCVSVKDESLFAPGNRNGWLTKLVNMLNDFGVSRPHVESECAARYAEAGFTEKEIMATIRSIYGNKTARHGCERYQPKAETEIVSFGTAKPACPIAVHHDGEPHKTQFSPEKGLLSDWQAMEINGHGFKLRVLPEPYDLTWPQFLEREAAFASAKQVRGSALVKDTISARNAAESNLN